MHTDAQGHRYYSAEEAWGVLGVRRSTFDRLVKDKKVKKYRKAGDRKYYYRVEDIEALKQRRDVEFKPVDEAEKEGTALAIAC